MRRLGQFLVTLALLAPAGCAPQAPADSAEPEPSNPHDFMAFGAADHAINATIGERAAIGPLVNVRLEDDREGEALRGVMFGKSLSLSIKQNRVDGLWGADRLETEVRRQEKRIHLEGLLRGRAIDLWIGPDAITGSLGASGYDLARKGILYEGTVTTSGQIENFTLKIPESLHTWSDPAFATLLAMLLAG